MSTGHEGKEARRLAFLLELRELTRKHGVAIGGCGCCGSPWLEDADVSDDRSGYGEVGNGQLCWIAPSNAYDWERYSADIVRPNAERVSP